MATVMGESLQFLQQGHHLSSSGRESPSSDSDQETLSVDVNNIKIVKQQEMFIWNPQYEKWHECKLTLKPPYLHITEHEDTRMEIQDKQLEHLQQSWYHGDISRREAKYILQDFDGGDGSFLVRASESYNGKFAISFLHESRIKHVVIETKSDPITGVLYHITPHGPFFNSLTGLIEEAKQTCIIQNHMFDVILTKSPPKPNQAWLHKNIRNLSQAEKLMRREQQDGSFLVYKTNSDYAPYSLVYRYAGSINHLPIMSGQRSSNAFTMNGVSAPVLYKVIHYFMENPITDDMPLLYPIEDRHSSKSTCAIACSDFTGDRTKNELTFSKGALITNISRRSSEWCVGDHRGDRQKFFPTQIVRFLSKDELQYVQELRTGIREKCLPLYIEEDEDDKEMNTNDSFSLNLVTDYTVNFDTEGSLSINIQPTNPLISSFRSFKLSCLTCTDMEQWYQVLKQNDCLPAVITEEESLTTVPRETSVATGNKRKGRKKRGSCIIS